MDHDADGKLRTRDLRAAKICNLLPSHVVRVRKGPENSIPWAVPEKFQVFEKLFGLRFL